ncbi:MAG TPA: ATP-binding protein [Candidatus Didemnitutus sp.]|nr:ATP-binding protein [Candidatus Didemnitutus sp.]
MLVLCIGLIVLFAVVCVASLIFSASIARDAQLITLDATPGSIYAGSIRGAIRDDLEAVTLALAEYNPAETETLLNTIPQYEAEYRRALERYDRTMLIDPKADAENVREVMVAADSYFQIRTRIVRQLREGKHSEATALLHTELRPAYLGVRRASDRMMVYNHGNVTGLSAAINNHINSLRWLTGAVLALALVAGSVVIFNLRTRRRELREMAEQTARLATAAKVARVALWVRHFDTDCIEWSQAINSLSAPDFDQMPRSLSGWFAQIHPDDIVAVRAAVEAHREHGNGYEIEYRLNFPTGKTVWVSDICGARDPKAPRSAMYGAVLDITTRKEAELSAARLESQMRHSQKLEAIGTLAGGIAHDFNNVLTGIMGNGEMLLMDMRDEQGDGPREENVETILRAGRRASDLVKQILTFSRQGESKREAVAVQSVVTEAMQLLRSTLPATIEITSDIDMNCPLVRADSTQIHQVLINLCTNSVHAMRGRQGHLRVTLEQMNADVEFVKLHAGLRLGRHLRLAVSDDGCGMTAVTMKRIFEPFFTTKAAGEGTGLGLSVVHGIIREHGGAIYPYSEVGKGTVFNIYLPTIATEVVSAAGPDQHGMPVGRRERILLVDDEADLRRTATNMLERLEYVVRPFANSKEALRAFEESPHAFDLVVTDLTMPHISGLDFSASIARIRPGTPLVLITGYTDDLSMDALREIGVRELLLKPLSMEGLAQAVRRALSTPLAEPELASTV